MTLARAGKCNGVLLDEALGPARIAWLERLSIAWRRSLASCPFSSGMSIHAVASSLM
jgi:hypothetical protein